MNKAIEEAIRGEYIANEMLRYHSTMLHANQKVCYQGDVYGYIIETRPIIHHPIVSVCDITAAVEASNPYMLESEYDNRIIVQISRHNGEMLFSEVIDPEHVPMLDAYTKDGVFYIQFYSGGTHFRVVSFEKRKEIPND